jgi:hypothetical protein
MRRSELAPTISVQLGAGDLWALQERELQLAATLEALAGELERVPSNPIRDALLAQCRRTLDGPSAGALEQVRIEEARRCREFLADAGYYDAADELGEEITARLLELSGR